MKMTINYDNGFGEQFDYWNENAPTYMYPKNTILFYVMKFLMFQLPIFAKELNKTWFIFAKFKIY